MSTCDINSNDNVLINGSRNNSIVLHTDNFLDERNNSMYFNITAYDEDGVHVLLEPFQFNADSESIYL